MKTQLLALTLALGMVVSCSKERPVEKLSMTDKTWIDKSIFTTDASGNLKNWIYKATVVKASTNGGHMFVGAQNSAKVGYFVITKDRLQLFNAVSPHEKLTTNSSQDLLNEWEATHHDVKLDSSGGKVSNKETEDTDKQWDKRRYISLDFSKFNIQEFFDFPVAMDEFACLWNKTSSKLVDNSLDVSDKYISFVVESQFQSNPGCDMSIRRFVREDITYSVQVRYSFKVLETNDYQPFAYRNDADPMLQKYGFFTTYREYFGGTWGQNQIKILMNRWDPRYEHKFFFTKEFPEQHKWIFTDPVDGIFAKTNALYEKAGLPTRFTIHDNTDVDGKVKEFGDIRYSFINFVEEVGADGPLGYGPSDANPFTGEIIAANLNLYTGELTRYVDVIKRGTVYQSTGKAKSSLLSKMVDTLKTNPDTLAQDLDFKNQDGAGTMFHRVLARKTFGYPGWAPFTRKEGNGKYTPIMQSESDESLMSLLKGSGSSAAVLEFQKKVSNTISKTDREDLSRPKINSTHATVTPLAPVLGGVQDALISGFTASEIIDNIIYTTAIHEFGHNLGMRHNFYGSVDTKNFNPAGDITRRGKTVKAQPATSSVMEYLGLEDELHSDWNWGPYDVATLSYGYSNGQQISKRELLFCTDEHTILNAMCNQWDTGSTPSQVVKSLISTYDAAYFLRNYRLERAFWDTSAYDSAVFRTMRMVKKFLGMTRTFVNKDALVGELKSEPLSSSKKEQVGFDIVNDMRQALKLSLAFYNAVLQQSSAERPWSDEVEAWSGALKRIGISSDKIYAMYFLMGDAGMMYDPNKNIYDLSYMNLLAVPDLAPLVEEITENVATIRVDMSPGFLGFAQALFADAATNQSNRGDESLINRIKIVKFSTKDLKDYFGIVPDPDQDIWVQRLNDSKHPAFSAQNDQVGIVRINDSFYMTSSSDSPYAYNAFRAILEGSADSIVQEKLDYLELYNLYVNAKSRN